MKLPVVPSPIACETIPRNGRIGLPAEVFGRIPVTYALRKSSRRTVGIRDHKYLRFLIAINADTQHLEAIEFARWQCDRLARHCVRCIRWTQRKGDSIPVLHRVQHFCRKGESLFIKTRAPKLNSICANSCCVVKMRKINSDV